MAYDVPDNLLRLGQDVSPDRLRYHNKRILVTKEFTFDAAHHLYSYEGKCKNLHGHTYRLQVSASAPVNEIGMAVDFGDLKQVVTSAVVDRLDHQYLNKVLPPMNTTAENMVVWIFEEIWAALKKRDEQATVERVVLWETPTSSVEVSREAMGW